MRSIEDIKIEYQRNPQGFDMTQAIKSLPTINNDMPLTPIDIFAAMYAAADQLGNTDQHNFAYICQLAISALVPPDTVEMFYSDRVNVAAIATKKNLGLPIELEDYKSVYDGCF